MAYLKFSNDHLLPPSYQYLLRPKSSIVYQSKKLTDVITGKNIQIQSKTCKQRWKKSQHNDSRSLKNTPQKVKLNFNNKTNTNISISQKQISFSKQQEIKIKRNRTTHHGKLDKNKNKNKDKSKDKQNNYILNIYNPGNIIKKQLTQNIRFNCFKKRIIYDKNQTNKQHNENIDKNDKTYKRSKIFNFNNYQFQEQLFGKNRKHKRQKNNQLKRKTWNQYKFKERIENKQKIDCWKIDENSESILSQIFPHAWDFSI